MGSVFPHPMDTPAHTATRHSLSQPSIYSRAYKKKTLDSACEEVDDLSGYVWTLKSIGIQWVLAVGKKPTYTELAAQVKALRERVAQLEHSPGGAGPPSELEIALRERVKELDCLYRIATLRETHFYSADQFLQGVAECLPTSWQFPEQACARIIYGGRHYVTERFRESKWRIAADVFVDGQVTGVVEVFYREVIPTSAGGPFLKEEYALIRAVAERVGSVLMHMKAQADLRAAHKAIQTEHQALQEANLALRAVLSRLEEEKRAIRASMLANIQKIIMPIVFELELEVTGRQRSYVTLLRQNLHEIASPFLTQICRSHLQLTPVEIAICTMVRNGLSTKEIARLRCISPATVRRHRENIRRKLDLKNRKVNLATYLQASFTDTQAEENADGYS